MDAYHGIYGPNCEGPVVATLMHMFDWHELLSVAAEQAGIQHSKQLERAFHSLVLPCDYHDPPEYHTVVQIITTQ